MPNWCHTRLTINGTEEQCRKFADAVPVEQIEIDIYDHSGGESKKIGTRTEEQIRIIQTFLPCPPELLAVYSPVRQDQAELAEANKKKFGYTDWYEWENDVWGVKWGDCQTELEDEDEYADGTYSITYSFETAWGTSTRAFVRISDMFPEIKFNLFYSEESGSFQGCEAIKAGKLVYTKFFQPDEYSVEPPEDYFSDAYIKWQNAQSEWVHEQQMKIDEEVDGLVW